jgi:hypothetical protein
LARSRIDSFILESLEDERKTVPLANSVEQATAIEKLGKHQRLKKDTL